MTGTKSQTIEAILTEVVEESVNLVTTNLDISLIEPDEFASIEFLDPNARLPRLQALRGGMLDFCGYFVGINEMAKAGFDLDTIVDQLTSYTFDDLKTVLGEMTPQADLDYENLELIRSWARKLARRAS